MLGKVYSSITLDNADGARASKNNRGAVGYLTRHCKCAGCRVESSSPDGFHYGVGIITLPAFCMAWATISRCDGSQPIQSL